MTAAKKAARGRGGAEGGKRARESGGGGTGLDRWWGGMSARRRDLLVILFFAGATAVFFAGFLLSDKMLFGTDIIPMGYAARKIYADFIRHNLAIPLWNPYILGGIPFVESFHGDIFYPASLLYLVASVHRAIGLKLVLHVFIAGVAMYVYLRNLSLSRGVAAVGGAGYMFAPYLISLIYAGHDAKMYVTALFPLLLYAIDRMSVGSGLRARPVVGGGLVVGLMLLSAHIQMAYFSLWGAGIYTVGQIVRRWRETGSARPAAVVGTRALAAVVLGLLIGLVQLAPPYVYTRTFSPRAGGVGYDYASSWSLHPEEVASLLVPEFGGYQDSYWGRNPFKINSESPGPVVLAIALGALAGLVRRRRWPVVPAVVIGFLALTYALGAHTPVHRLFYAVIPGVKFFRAPSIIMFQFSWAAATLAALGLERALRPADRGKALLAAAGVWWGILIVAYVMRGGFFDLWCSLFRSDISDAARKAMQADVGPFLLGASLAGVLVVAAALAVRYAGALGRGGTAIVLLVVVLAADWRVDTHFIQLIRLGDFVVREQIVSRLQQDPGIFRVLPVTGRQNIDNNYFPIFGIQTANGFHDNRIARYDLLKNNEHGVTPRLLALLNVKYLVTAQPVEQPPALTTITSSGLGNLVENRGTLPRAFLVHRYRVLDDEEAVEQLVVGDIPLREEIVLAEDPGALELAEPPADAGESVDITAYTMREVRMRVHAAAPALLYFADNWYPSWHAHVDGKDARMLRANVTFRAIPVPAGEHEVHFTYSSPLLSVSLAGSGVGLAGAVIFLGVAVWAGRRRGVVFTGGSAHNGGGRSQDEGRPAAG